MAFSTELLCFSYACSSQNPDMVEKLKHSNKILLPESMLFELTKDSHDSLENKLYFKVSHKETGYGEVCGVHEFSSPPGVVHLPYHIMNSCCIEEGSNVNIELVAPPKGDFVKLRLHNSKEFSKLSDPKAVLEKIMSRDYPVVTQGQTIALHYTELNKVFMIDIVETKPSEIIEILNADINVDFDKALDYEVPKPEAQVAWSESKSKARDVSANLQNYKNNNICQVVTHTSNCSDILKDSNTPPKKLINHLISIQFSTKLKSISWTKQLKLSMKFSKK